MQTFKILIVVSILMFMIHAHEKDMHRNCTEQGNARAWFVEIQCTEMMEKPNAL